MAEINYVVAAENAGKLREELVGIQLELLGSRRKSWLHVGQMGRKIDEVLAKHCVVDGKTPVARMPGLLSNWLVKYVEFLVSHCSGQKEEK